MYRAGDRVLVHIGRRTGHVLEVEAVRMFATDRGYFLHGGEGLYRPDQVELVAERTGGNPCGSACNANDHRLFHVCEHCRGVCWHWPA